MSEERMPSHSPRPVCAVMEPLLPLLVRDELAAAEADAVRAHVAGCAWCQDRLREYERLVAGVRDTFAVAWDTGRAKAPWWLTLEDVARASSRGAAEEGDMETNRHDAAPRAAQVTEPAARGRQRPRGRLEGLGALAAVLAVAILVGAVLMLHGGPSGGGGGTSTPNTATPGTTSTTITRGNATLLLTPFYQGPRVIEPGRMVLGSDGNAWLIERNQTIARVSPSGALKEFALPAADYNLGGIAADRSGGVWVSDFMNGALWRVDVATGAARKFVIPAPHSQPQGLAAGLDGMIWYTDISRPIVGRLDPQTGAFKEYVVPGRGGTSAVTVGPDGAVWFSLANQDIWMGRLDPATGAFKEYRIPHVNINNNPPGTNAPSYLIAGPGGNIWFSINNSNTNGEYVGYVTPQGAVHELTVDGGPYALAPGPDGNMWFTNLDGTLDRVVPDGTITKVLVANSDASEMMGLVLGPDQRLWTAYEIRGNGGNADYLVRVSLGG